MSDRSDQELIRLAKAGDSEATYQLAKRLLRTWECTLDLLLESDLRMIERQVRDTRYRLQRRADELKRREAMEGRLKTLAPVLEAAKLDVEGAYYLSRPAPGQHTLWVRTRGLWHKVRGYHGYGRVATMCSTRPRLATAEFTIEWPAYGEGCRRCWRNRKPAVALVLREAA